MVNYDDLIARLEEELFELEKDVRFLKERLRNAEQTLGNTKLDLFNLSSSYNKKTQVRSSVDKIRKQIIDKESSIENKKKEIRIRTIQRCVFNLFSNRAFIIATAIFIVLIVGLYLYSQRHIHTWVDATCDKPKHCTGCDATEGEALGHDWIEATCTNPPHCKRCGLSQGSGLGHEYSEATCTEPATCIRCGTKSGQALGHDVPGLSCTDGGTCQRCGVEVPPLGHNWINATCTEPSKCARCGLTTGSPTGHTWQDATCTTPQKCMDCGETRGEALGHNWVEATYTEPKKCTRCGQTEGSPLVSLPTSETSIRDYASVLEKFVKQWDTEHTQYRVTRFLGTVYIRVLSEGLADHEDAVLAGDKSALKSWNNLVANSVDLCKVVRENMDNVGLKYYNIEVYVVDPRDTDSILIASKNGDLYFDGGNGIDLR